MGATESNTRVYKQPEATCIGCGCTDSRACAGGCSWLRLDRHKRVGVCSQCEDDLARWVAGDRALRARSNSGGKAAARAKDGHG